MNLVKPVLSLDDFLLESESQWYTYEEMKEFLNQIIQYMAEPEINKEYPWKSKIPYVSIPSDRVSTLQVRDLENVSTAFDKLNSVYGDKNPKYKVWKAKFSNPELSVNTDINTLLDTAKKNPGELIDFSVTFNDDDSAEFAEKMRSGETGPLD